MNFLGEPVLRSILQESKSDLIKHVELLNAAEKENMALHFLSAALAWPEGIQILLSHGLPTHVIDKSGQCILDTVLHRLRVHWDLDWEAQLQETPAPVFGAPVPLDESDDDLLPKDVLAKVENDSLHLLIQAGAQPSRFTWLFALMTRDMQIIQLVAQALTYHTKRGSYSANWLLTYVYQYVQLTVVAAEALFDAGLHDVDYDAALRFHLMCLHVPEHGGLQKFILISWLASRSGVNGSEIRHPDLHTTPAHVLSEELVMAQLIETENIEGPMDWCDSGFEYLVRSVFESRQLDDCRCACSWGGCTVIATAFKSTHNRLIHVSTRCTDEEGEHSHDMELKRFLIETFLRRCGVDLDADTWARSSALRIITFDRLRLSHTCHNLEHTRHRCKVHPRNSLTEEEISKTQEVESKDIALLEELLNEFDGALEAYTGTFLQFIDGYWTRTMNEKRPVKERSSSPIEELEKIRDFGVFLGPKRPQDTVPGEVEVVPQLPPLETLQWGLERIMDGSYLEERYRRHFEL
jgi:hypothetical protein